MAIMPLEMLLRLAVGTLVGGLIGYERERSGHAAGLRTHLLVALASTLFMLVSTQFYYFQHYATGDLISVDPSRIAASVVTGVGFLGAGAILRTGLNVHGLTTAASLWLVAALGLAAGGGMYLATATSFIASLIALILLRRFENNRDRLLLRRMEFKLGNVGVRQSIIEELQALGVSVVESEYAHDLQTHEVTLLLDLRLPDESVLSTLLARMETFPDLHSFKVQRPDG